MHPFSLKNRLITINAKTSPILCAITRADIMIFIFMVLFVIISFSISHWSQEVGDAAIVEVNGQLYAKINLSQSGFFYIPGAYGVLTLKIESGTVRILSSPCPHQICLHRGGIMHAGDMIVCVPNRVVVRVLGSGKISYNVITG